MSINFESHKLDRRSFLKGAGVIGAALILLGIVMHNYHKSDTKASDAAAESRETSRAA